MSFAFPKPVPDSRTRFSDSDFDINRDERRQIILQRGPDYDEIIIPLSLYAFNRLSPSDQQEQLEELRRRHDFYVNVEDSDFIELFKKLTYSDQRVLLSKFLQKFKHERRISSFKRERLIFSFKQLDAEHQQQLIESMNHLAPEENLPDPQETEADFRLRRFTQLCRDHTRDVLKLTWKSEDEQEEDSSDWESFFLGFSIIWFQGQLASGQDMLIEQLSKRVGGTVVIEPRLQDDETEEDFKLRTFTELCNKIVDFQVQVKFLNNADQKLRLWGIFHKRSIVELQEYDCAAQLLSDLSTLGCSLMSAEYQRHKIEEMSKLVDGGVTIIEESTDEEDFRMKRFKELFNQVPVPTRIDLFEELRQILLKEKRYSEAVRFFRGRGSKDQTDMIEKLSDEITKYQRDPAELIIGKFSGESEEDFSLRRFKKVCIKHLSTWEYICWQSEADRKRVRKGTSEESSCYASLLFDASITWFKAICADYRRNPSFIHDILFGQVEFRDHVIEKLPEESEEDFRLRRFTESFKRLDFTSQVRILDYIQRTIFHDLGHPEPKWEKDRVSETPEGKGWFDLKCEKDSVSETPEGKGRFDVKFQQELVFETPEGKGWFDPEWIKMKLPDLQDKGAAAAAATTQGATSQAGGGRTSTSTVR